MSGGKAEEIIRNYLGRIIKMTKKSIANDTMENVMDLSQKSAKLALKGAVQTAEVTENFVQGMYKAGYDTNVEALKVAKNYWDAATQIRQDWLNLFSNTGESVIKTVGNMELPLQKEVADIAKNVMTNVEKTVENFAGQAKAATK